MIRFAAVAGIAGVVALAPNPSPGPSPTALSARVTHHYYQNDRGDGLAMTTHGRNHDITSNTFSHATSQRFTFPNACGGHGVTNTCPFDHAHARWNRRYHGHGTGRIQQGSLCVTSSGENYKMLPCGRPGQIFVRNGFDDIPVNRSDNRNTILSMCGPGPAGTRIITAIFFGDVCRWAIHNA